MGLGKKLKGIVTKILSRDEIAKKFNTEVVTSTDMYDAIKDWDNLYRNSISNLASVISSEAARLATIEMDITFTGGVRAKRLQEIINQNKGNLRRKLELGIAYGGMVLKPDGIGGIDFIPPTRYFPVEYDTSGNITAMIFIDVYQKGSSTYNRLEYHHFEDSEDGERLYIIENLFYKSQNVYTLGSPVSKNSLDMWKNLEDETVLVGIEKPLWGYFKMPNSNTVDIDSPLGTSIYSKATDSIEDFDVLYSKWRREIELSDKILFVNNDAMMRKTPNGGRAEIFNPFPKLIKGLQFGMSANRCIDEYNPSIRVSEFKESIQIMLNLISIQCGFSSGFLTFDSKRGVVTATQIESEDQRTVSLCTDIQEQYKVALEGLVYALNVFEDLNDEFSDKFEVNYYLKDLFVNTSEDRKRSYELAQNGYIPKWKYLEEFEGYTEEEAKSMVQQAEQNGGTKSVITDKNGNPIQSTNFASMRKMN